jgi:HSP20 family protein
MADATEHSMQGDPGIRRLSRWVDSVLTKAYHTYCPDQTWAPAVNLYESQQAYHAVFDLAGIDPGAIELYVEKEVLTLVGRRGTCGMPSGPDCVVHLMEIDHGRFCRQVELPGDVEVDEIRALYRSGLLVVELPRKV